MKQKLMDFDEDEYVDLVAILNKKFTMMDITTSKFELGSEKKPGYIIMTTKHFEVDGKKYNHFLVNDPTLVRRLSNPKLIEAIKFLQLAPVKYMKNDLNQFVLVDT